jgi:hypothetical protein
MRAKHSDCRGQTQGGYVAGRRLSHGDQGAGAVQASPEPQPHGSHL